MHVFGGVCEDMFVHYEKKSKIKFQMASYQN